MKKIFALTILLSAFLFSFSQEEEIKQDVIVVKDYLPSISDAQKISFMPRFNDTLKISPDFDYSIHTKQIATKYEIIPISAAKMQGEPLQKLYGNHMLLGFGTRLSPIAQIYVNSKRSKKSSYGAWFKHNSSHGKVVKDNLDFFPTFSQNEAKVYGSRFLKSGTLSGDLEFDADKYTYYGWLPGLVDDTDSFNDKDNFDHQNFYKLKVSGKFDSKTKRNKLGYSLATSYQFFGDKFGMQEHLINFDALFNKNIKKFDGDVFVNLEFDFQNKAGEENIFELPASDTISNIALNLNPFFEKKSEQLRYKIGFRLDNVFNPDEDSQTSIYPDLSFDYFIARDFLVSYFAFTGGMQLNTYQSLASQNPYIYSDYPNKITNIKKKIIAGLKGKFSKSLSFDFTASFFEVKNFTYYRLFYNDIFENSITYDMTFNRFDVNYIDVDYGKFSAFINYKSEKINSSLKADFYTFSEDIETLDHVPTLTSNFSFEYIYLQKIVTGFGINYTGVRYAKSLTQEDYDELDAIFDINLTAEYLYNKNLSAFLKVDNLLNQKYEIWQAYPSPGFNLILGASYSF